MSTIENCEVCVKLKMTYKSFNKDRDQATRACEMIHMDFIGPITPCIMYTRYILWLIIIQDS